MDFKTNKVQKLRIYKGLKQIEVAEKLGMSIGTYRKIEDNTRELSVKEEITLANLFGVRTNQLYN